MLFNPFQLLLTFPLLCTLHVTHLTSARNPLYPYISSAQLYNLYDVTHLCITLCMEISQTLDTPIFRVPQQNIDRLKAKLVN